MTDVKTQLYWKPRAVADRDTTGYTREDFLADREELFGYIHELQTENPILRGRASVAEQERDKMEQIMRAALISRDEAVAALENVRALAVREKSHRREHRMGTDEFCAVLLRFCAEAGVVAKVTREDG